MTLKQALVEVQQWCFKAQEDEFLCGRLQQLQRAVLEAAEPIQADLGSATISDEFRQLLEGSHGAYLDIVESLTGIVAAIRQRDVSSVSEERLYLQAAVGSLRQYTEAIEQWLLAPHPRCPRCGLSEDNPEWICPDCDLEYLYPDLEPNSQASRTFLTLGQEYLAVYRTYLSVASGDAPLADLADPLQRLTGYLAQHRDIQKLSNDSALRPLLERIGSLCQASLEGVERMKLAFSGRQMADLNRGWLEIFKAAGELQKCIPNLQDHLGLRPETTHQTGSDSVEFSE